ncbi:hypothetical protein GCM10023205_60050 [Yinghuangia aomiensis]|uniref:Uncharacterized protein n=1 Tax=Yinghuangia aomiensis TaxID=676205 RepID=A0ABP9HYS3_9ACTN
MFDAAAVETPDGGPESGLVFSPLLFLESLQPVRTSEPATTNPAIAATDLRVRKTFMGSSPWVTQVMHVACVMA